MLALEGLAQIDLLDSCVVKTDYVWVLLFALQEFLRIQVNWYRRETSVAQSSEMFGHMSLEVLPAQISEELRKIDFYLKA